MSLELKTIPIEEYDEFLQSWDKVPYRDGGGTRQGVDCFRFAVVVLDFLSGMEGGPELSPKLPRETSQHDQKATWGVIDWLVTRYNGESVWRRSDGGLPSLEPGDIVLVNCGELPGHVLVAGAQKNILWHAVNAPFLSTGGCVQKTSLGWAITKGLVRVWRCRNSQLTP